MRGLRGHHLRVRRAERSELTRGSVDSAALCGYAPGVLIGSSRSVTLALVLTACSSKGENAPAASAEAATSPSNSTARPSASAAATVPGPPAPRAVVQASFPRRTTVTSVGRAVLACTGGCLTGTADIPSKVETFLVDRKGSRKTPLFPESVWRKQYNNNPTIFGESRRVSFSGSYPDDLWASLDAPYDRGGYGAVAPVRAGETGWAFSERVDAPRESACASSGSIRALLRLHAGCDDAGHAFLARKLLPSLATASEDPQQLVVLPNGGAALVFERGYGRLVGGKWEKKPAPWSERPERVVALEDGSFVTASKDGVHLVSKNDQVVSVDLVESGGPEATLIKGATETSILPVGDELWVRFVDGDNLKLAAVDEAARWKRYLPPVPKEEAKAAEVELPVPVKLTDSCTTPFVMLASNNDPHYTFRASTEVFFGHDELQGALTFVQLTRDKTTFFGVQTKTREQAEKAVEIGKGMKLSPQLTCLDALGHIPDLTRPPAGVRVYFANLSHKQLLWP